MKNKFINYNVNKLKLNNKYSESDLRIYIYGLEATYSMVTKFAVVILIAYFMNTLNETLWLILFYTFIRSFAFGIHASKNLYCWIITLSVYTIVPFIIKNYLLSSYLYYFIFLLTSIIIAIYAPADTPKRPLLNEKKRNRCKIISIINILILLTISIISNDLIIENAIIWTMILQAICINPLIYKLTKTQLLSTN